LNFLWDARSLQREAFNMFRWPEGVSELHGLYRAAAKAWHDTRGLIGMHGLLLSGSWGGVPGFRG
jgi:hypothetical protein